jgi:hypothetical protein
LVKERIMILMVDIKHEAILEASKEIKKCKKKCKILPTARFNMLNGSTDITYSGLVCDDRMGGEQTGVGAEYCNNCRLKK